MDKVTKQRDPKQQSAGRKGHEKYMVKLKEDILKNVGNGGSNTTNDSTNGGINTTNDSTGGGSYATSNTTSSTITNYIHGVRAIAVLSLGVCIFIKWMRNPSQPDKDPEISKGPEKISKIRQKIPRRSNKRRTSHYRSNSWNFLATKDGQNSFTSKGSLGCIRHHQTQQRRNNWSIAQRLCCL